ncbi:MAG: CvpA family protein [Deltaproteobacteria bacterium]|nr:CvpA family protein [Deltaproteobacteria bacterium]MBW1833558.1 CvpA family protein [Deltaproteobacteria bacterium]MBW2165431.1 CvpA family protein [Deltaproteobacteria bacterium]
MNKFDILIVIVFGFCLIRGFFRGFIKEMSSIVGVLGGFYAAYTYYLEVARPLSGWISDKSYLHIISFLIIFCIVFLIISILGVVIKYILNIAFLGWFDRICGAGFGIIKATLMVSVLLIAFTAFLPKGAPIVKDSMLSPHVLFFSEKMAKVIPEDMKHQFVSKIEELKKAWKKS